MSSRMARQPGHRHSGEMLREVVAAVVPEDDCERYLPFARELYATFRNKPQASSRKHQAPDFSRRTKMTVMKWFRRGLSGHLMWLIGERLIGRLFATRSSRYGTN
jgi:hypothetical protein